MGMVRFDGELLRQLAMHRFDNLPHAGPRLPHCCRHLPMLVLPALGEQHQPVLRPQGGGEDAPRATVLLSVMGAFAAFERALIRERQREGIAVAKQRGV